jgi:hypothetical protein
MMEMEARNRMRAAASAVYTPVDLTPDSNLPA